MTYVHQSLTNNLFAFSPISKILCTQYERFEVRVVFLHPTKLLGPRHDPGPLYHYLFYVGMRVPQRSRSTCLMDTYPSCKVMLYRLDYRTQVPDPGVTVTSRPWTSSLQNSTYYLLFNVKGTVSSPTFTQDLGLLSLVLSLKILSTPSFARFS